MGLTTGERVELLTARHRIHALEAELAVHRRSAELLKEQNDPNAGSGRPGWARPCWRSASSSPPAGRGSPSTSRPWTTWWLKAAEATGRFQKKLQTYLEPSVLVVDEVGYLPLPRAEANMVFQLVTRRHERGSIVVTSNKVFSEWGHVFGDHVLASAILDRLLRHGGDLDQLSGLPG